jgi:transcription elongation factor GreA
MISSEITFYMTETGVQKAQTALETLENDTRPEILGYLQDAHGSGDSSENTEFLYLSQDLEIIDRRIRDLKYRLARVQIIEHNSSKETVTLGSTVVIQESGTNSETYTIVGSAEANPVQGCISNESPLGRALLDHKIGEEITVDSPDGPWRFLIAGIS